MLDIITCKYLDIINRQKNIEKALKKPSGKPVIKYMKHKPLFN